MKEWFAKLVPIQKVVVVVVIALIGYGLWQILS
jgi:hypothetical protein